MTQLQVKIEILFDSEETLAKGKKKGDNKQHKT